MDTLVANLRRTQAHHASLIRSGNERALCEAYIASLEAARTLLLECGGPDDLAAAEQLVYQVDDERAALAEMA